MTDNKPQTKSQKAQQDKQDRLAQALRDNLFKRKAQARNRQKSDEGAAASDSQIKAGKTEI